MDISPPKLNAYKRVVPLKGSKLQKLKNAFQQELQNGLNRIKTEDVPLGDEVIKIESLPEEKEQAKAPDSKIIIQKVEKVTYDVSSLLFLPDKSKSSLPEAGCSSSSIDRNDATPQTIVAIAQDSPEKKSETTNVSVLTSQYPENAFNTKVPLKMVKIIKQPKPKPNLAPRVHRVQTFRPSQVPTLTLPQPEVKDEPVVSTPVVMKKEEPAAKKVIVNKVMSDNDSSDCCGFDVDSDEPTIVKYYDFLKLSEHVQDGTSTSGVKNGASTSGIKVEKPSSPAKRITRQSSMLRETKSVADLKSPKKSVTKLPVVKAPKPLSNSWQNDILAVIGTSRLNEIDEMLKNIPNIIDNDFNPIEMENVELKLIIKHLLRKLKVESITDTLRPGDSKPRYSSGDSSNDEDGSFPGDSSFDEDTQFSGPPSDSDSSAFDDESFRDDSQPGPSRQASQDIEHLNGEVIQQASDVPSFDMALRDVSVELEDCFASQNAIEVVDKRKRSTDGHESKPHRKKQRISDVEAMDRRRSLRSSSCGSTTSVKEEKSPVKAVTLEEPAKSPFLRRLSLRSSSIESLKKDAKIEKPSPVKAVVVRELRNRSKTPDKAVAPKKTSRVEELRSSDSESGPRLPRSTRKARIASSSTDSSSSRSKLKSAKAAASSDPKVKIAKSLAKNRTSKTIDSESDSESVKDDQSRKAELKSRLNPLDSNSTRKSSIFIRNDYLKNSSDKQNKFSADFSRMVQKLSKTVEATKVSDPTYVSPPKIVKRERLRTSAFKGNDDDLSDSTTQEHSTVIDTRPPSVSRDSSDDESLQPKKSSAKHQKFSKLHAVKKKIYVQEIVEPANEKKVPYAALLEVIRTSLPNKKLGRVNSATKDELEKIRKENLAKLRSLEFLICGSCNFKVTKHKWVEHYLSHGGLAWMHNLEPPLNMLDWNDLLRRSINAFRIFDVSMAMCPNCDFQRKSALGHMSHMLACGESPEEVDRRKQTCELCQEKFFPFNATLHKKSCKKIEAPPPPDVNDGDDEVESGGEDDKTKSFNGRFKRKATRKAEKKFKKILKTEKPADYLHEVNGTFSCKICRTTLESREDAFDHMKNSHEVALNDGDFEGSDSDVEIAQGESSETEGSSGVDSSEPESDDAEQNYEGDSNDENNVSSKKAKQSNHESQEVKNARVVGTEYFESLRDQMLWKRIYNWTKDFHEVNWKAEVLTEILPKVGSNPNKSAKIALALLNFDQFSVKFGSRMLERYALNYEHKFDNKWTRLEIGEDASDKTSSTIFCGGAVSSIDWAPGTDDLDFLAVACNVPTMKLKLDLVETTKSCVQLYEFKNLMNEKFAGFQDSARLCYAIIIDDGPILSLRFHPSKSDIEKRVGILAVATANASVFIYSLPYLSNVKSVILPIEPNVVCKLEKDIVLFNNEYLLQVSKVAWYQKSGTDSILAAGFINGMVALWNVSESADGKTKTLFPNHVLHQHLEPITGLDFKASTGDDFHLMTASLDRKIKVFTFDDCCWQEVASNYTVSRIFCAEWWMNWPGFLIGFDDCLSQTHFFYRQPLEFAVRNESLMTMHSSIVHLSINHWDNHAIMVTDAGDVFDCAPRQLMQNYTKDKWSHYNFSLVSSTDYNKVTADENENEEIAVVFGDFKANTPPAKNKKWRLAPTDRINELQINQVCFNRNEKSHRFFALGYETGFVRIKYLKNSK